jgi:uncharacterized protein YjiS (DUF1127 family)
MSNITANAPATHGLISTVFRSVTSFFRAIAQGMVAYGQAKARAREITALNAMSDLKLASLGLRRENIARYVLRDLFVS